MSPLAMLSYRAQPWFMDNHSSHCLSPLLTLPLIPPAMIDDVNYAIMKYALLLKCDFWPKSFPLVYFWHYYLVLLMDFEGKDV